MSTYSFGGKKAAFAAAALSTKNGGGGGFSDAVDPFMHSASKVSSSVTSNQVGGHQMG